MSHSFKHTHIAKQKNSAFGKRQANKATRRREDVPNGRQHRRHYNPWDICDWSFRAPTIQDYIMEDREPTKRERDSYRRHYISK